MTEKQEKDEAARGEELVFYCKTEEGEKVRWAIESAFVEPPSFAETDGEGERSSSQKQKRGVDEILCLGELQRTELARKSISQNDALKKADVSSFI